MIMPFKKALFRFFFGIEILLFTWTYIFGVHGIQQIFNMRHENTLLAQKVVALHTEIDQLNYTIEQWKRIPFYQEKFAREQLQMARPHDEIYYLVN